MPAGLGSLILELRAETGHLVRGVNTAVGSMKKIETGFSRLQTLALTFAGAQGLGAMVGGIVQAGTRLEGLQIGFESTTGSADMARSSLAFVGKEADRLGVDLTTAREGFGKLTASAQNTAFEGEGVREIYTAIASAMRVHNKSADETAGAIRAITQMMDKGRVMSEELRGQLAERLSGAFNIASRAMGVSTEQLGKMLEQGLDVKDFLIPFARELQKTLGDGVTKAANSSQAAFSRLRNSFTRFKETLARSGLVDLLASIARGITKVVDTMVSWIIRLREARMELAKMNSPEIEARIERISELLAFNRGTYDRLVEGLKEATEAQDKYQMALKPKEIEEVNKQHEILKSRLAEAKDELKKLNSPTAGLPQHNANLAKADKATTGVSKATDDATDSVKGLAAEVDKGNDALAEAGKLVPWYTDKLAEKTSAEDRAADAARRAAKADQEAAAAADTRNSAIVNLAGGLSVLFGVATPDSVGALAQVFGSVGTIAGLDPSMITQLAAGASSGGGLGGFLGGGGTGAATGGALGGIAGSLLGGGSGSLAALFAPIGGPVTAALALGAIGGLMGGVFDSGEQQPSVSFHTAALGSFERTRGPVGQRGSVATGELGQVVVHGADGQNRTEAMQDFADSLVQIDNAIAPWLDQDRLQAATEAAQMVSNTTRTGKFSPEENLRLRTEHILSAIGGVEDELFQAFNPTGEMVPQVLSAINILRDMGDESRAVAIEWQTHQESFLPAVIALQEIQQLVSMENPFDVILEDLELLGRGPIEALKKQKMATMDVIEAFDGSQQSMIEMSMSLGGLRQAAVQAIVAIDTSLAATTATTNTSLQRIQEIGYTPEDIFHVRQAQAGGLLEELRRGTIGTTGGITSAVTDINRLLTGGLFGLSEESQLAERENIMGALEEAQALANQQLEAMRQSAEDAFNLQVESAGRMITSSANLNEAASNLNVAAERIASAATGGALASEIG